MRSPRNYGPAHAVEARLRSFRVPVVTQRVTHSRARIRLRGPRHEVGDARFDGKQERAQGAGRRVRLVLSERQRGLSSDAHSAPRAGAMRLPSFWRFAGLAMGPACGPAFSCPRCSRRRRIARRRPRFRARRWCWPSRPATLSGCGRAPARHGHGATSERHDRPLLAPWIGAQAAAPAAASTMRAT